MPAAVTTASCPCSSVTAAPSTQRTYRTPGVRRSRRSALTMSLAHSPAGIPRTGAIGRRRSTETVWDSAYLRMPSAMLRGTSPSGWAVNGCSTARTPPDPSVETTRAASRSRCAREDPRRGERCLPSRTNGRGFDHPDGARRRILALGGFRER